jgi:tetratricopeptide (TPR) repeat protein
MTAPDLMSAAQNHLNAGRGLDALNAAKRALQAAPNDGNAVYLMAASFRMLNRMDDAERLLNRLNQAMPQQPDILNMLGLTLRDQGRPDDARRTFDTGRRHAPARHPIWGNLALLLQDYDPDAAITLYQEMIRLDPGNIEPKAMLAAFYAVRGNVDETLALVDDVLAIDAHHLTANSARAEAMLLEKKPELARDCLRSILPSAEGPPLNLALAWRRLAKAHDALDETKDAFAAWTQANTVQRKEWSERWELYDGPRSVHSARRLSDWFTNNTPTISKQRLQGPAPVFQVGFPRSGTTLLENMLAAHPKIVTLQEQDSIMPIIEAIGDTPDTLCQLDRLAVSEINELRARYWEKARRDGASNSDPIMIDKYPTNLVWLGVLGRIFPDAKIILCLRDPRDCVLSAFQQHFAINPEMYRTLTLDDCANLYDACMAAGMASIKSLPKQQIITVRYDDLIADHERQIKRVLDHLALDWDDEIRNYRVQASQRRITTPSAPQVVQPLYTSSLGKWTRYATQMKPIMATLENWVNEFGYDEVPR